MFTIVSIIVALVAIVIAAVAVVVAVSVSRRAQSEHAELVSVIKSLSVPVVSPVVSDEVPSPEVWNYEPDPDYCLNDRPEVVTDFGAQPLSEVFEGFEFDEVAEVEVSEQVETKTEEVAPVETETKKVTESKKVAKKGAKVNPLEIDDRKKAYDTAWRQAKASGSVCPKDDAKALMAKWDEVHGVETKKVETKTETKKVEKVTETKETKTGKTEVKTETKKVETKSGSDDAKKAYDFGWRKANSQGLDAATRKEWGNRASKMIAEGKTLAEVKASFGAKVETKTETKPVETKTEETKETKEVEKTETKKTTKKGGKKTTKKTETKVVEQAPIFESAGQYDKKDLIDMTMKAFKTEEIDISEMHVALTVGTNKTEVLKVAKKDGVLIIKHWNYNHKAIVDRVVYANDSKVVSRDKVAEIYDAVVTCVLAKWHEEHAA